MVDLVEVTNRALQVMGSRTSVASMTEVSNEARQSSLIIEKLRDELIRKAPWNFATKTAQLTFITSAPGTPENPNASSLIWAPGIPAPPWAYEYQYPVDCLRPLWIVPQFATGFGGGVPITTAITGGIPSFWMGPPVKFKVANDQFFAATGATVAAGGSGYAVGDVITLATPASGLGAPAQLRVATIGGGGAVATVSLVTNVFNEVLAGSYFSVPTNPVAQGSTTGVGVGATFTLSYAATPPAQGDQRIILTNQESAICVYLKRVTDANVMDDTFIECWVNALAAKLAIPLSGDKAMLQACAQLANNKIMEARQADGNEGLLVNDVTPDWLRARGIAYPNWEFTPNQQFNWGPLFSPFG